jgi:hypothetical protein
MYGCVIRNNGVTVESGVSYAVHADSYVCNHGTTVGKGVFCGVRSETV